MGRKVPDEESKKNKRKFLYLFIYRVYTSVANRRFNNTTSSTNLEISVQSQDLKSSLNSMLQERKGTIPVIKDSPKSPAYSYQNANPVRPPQVKVSTSQAPELTVEKQEKQEEKQEKKEKQEEKSDIEDDKLTSLTLQEWELLSNNVADCGFSLDDGIQLLQNNPNALAQLSKKYGKEGAKLLLKRAEKELERRKAAEEQAEKERAAEIERLQKIQEFEKADKLRIEQEKEEQLQRELQEMGNCSMGFRWLRVDGGYRCAGGSHFMNDHEIPKRS